MTTATLSKRVEDTGSENVDQNYVLTDATALNTNKNNFKRISTEKKPSDIGDNEDIDRLFRKNVEAIFVSIPENWNNLTKREQREWVETEFKKAFKNLPMSLMFLCVGSCVNIDCGRPVSVDTRPEWLDHEKFLRGQRFAMKNLSGIFFAELLSLYMLLSFQNGMNPLILTQKSSDPFTAFKRYLSTGHRVKNWYSSDVWTEGTVGHNDIQTVRRMHDNVRRRLLDMSPSEIAKATSMRETWSTSRKMLIADFRSSCPAARPGQCPYLFSKEDEHKKPIGLNQTEMSVTQFGFLGLIILYPEKFGIYGASDDDLDAFCHLWRSIGYLLGIEDDFNFCGGTLEEVKQRSRDLLECWIKPNFRDLSPEWEHMVRCLMEGIRYYFPATTYEHGMLYLTELLGIEMPRLKASLSYTSWIHYNIMKKIYWAARFPGVTASINRRLIKCMDRGTKFTKEHIDELQKRSKRTLSKGIAETTMATSNDVGGLTISHKTPFILFLSTCVLLNLPIIITEFARKLMRSIDSDSAFSC